MRTITVSETGSPEVLVPTEAARPTPAPDQVLVEVAAAGINFIDTYRRSGVYPAPLPHTPGSEGAGTVVEVGAEVTNLQVGDRVAWADGPGSYAQYVAVPAERAVPIPADLSFEHAAALPLQGMTAHYLAFDTAPLQFGDIALVHAAAGGVGLLLVQLLKSQGINVIGTVSTQEKAQLAREAGADNVIRYDQFEDLTTELPSVVRALYPDGVQAVFDGVGKATFDASLASLARCGSLVLFGGASGQVEPVDLQRLSAAGSVWVTRPSLGDFIATPQQLTARMSDLMERVATGELTLRIGATYPLNEAARAHQDLEARATNGKLLLLP